MEVGGNADVSHGTVAPSGASPPKLVHTRGWRHFLSPRLFELRLQNEGLVHAASNYTRFDSSSVHHRCVLSSASQVNLFKIKRQADGAACERLHTGNQRCGTISKFCAVILKMAVERDHTSARNKATLSFLPRL